MYQALLDWIPLYFIDRQTHRFSSVCLLNCIFHRLHLVLILLIGGNIKIILATSARFFSSDRRTFRSGKTHSQTLHPKMSINTEKTADASEICGTQEIDKSIKRISSELIEKKFRPKLNLLNGHISIFTQLLNQLIQDKSAKTTPTAGTRAHGPQMGLQFDRSTGAFRTSPDMAIGGTGLSPYRHTSLYHYRIFQTRVFFRP